MAQREIVQKYILRVYSSFALLFLPLLIALQYPDVVWSKDNSIVVVNQANLGYHKEFTNRFKETIREKHPHGKVVEIDIDDIHHEKRFTDILSSASVIVTVGSKAADIVTEFEASAPTLHSLITSRSHKQLHRASACPHNVLYLEQPVERLIGLVTITLPTFKKLGILLTHNTGNLKSRIEQTATKHSLDVISLELKDKGQLNSLLKDIFSRSEALLTLPDPLIINSLTARTVLEGAYLHRIPIISYSKSMVKAGALLAVYSTPKQLGAESAEIAMKMLTQGCTRKSSATYSINYSIAVNYQVARALGLDIQKEAVLLGKLKRLMATQ
jgi:putative ABC transport system substrate-binding protein